ncbi:glycoside hydrolase family 28 protein [Donghicola mangrovi]|uniref:Glycoside hydrolase family 28 protein n=1 Tax=Donghicola mangrovi TaxID=2729614 RepID=A0A850QGY4_9RHOB|nr:glycoside hydrolase family 28 protein [Donghicola mangrovi]NVO25319.1 glycoside hydrolase family 28 protein [Donghicola mangrovi]
MLSLTALSVRTIAFCYAPDGARYYLPEMVPWTLSSAGTVQHGQTGTALTVIDDLIPDTDYALTVVGETLPFRTPPCAGLVDITDHGAIADGPDTASHAAENARALIRAIGAAPKCGTVLIPEGTWVCAPMALRSDLTLWLKGTLKAPADRTGWPILPARNHAGKMLGSWEGLPADCFAAPIYAVGTERLTIAGPGALEGGGDRGDWWSWSKDTRQGARRPRGLHLVNCQHTQLIGFSVRNAPSWTVHPQGCHDLTIAGLHISAPDDSPNTDGCNPEMCQKVRLTGVRFSVGDDCIAIKAGKRGDQGQEDHLTPTRDIAITHCLMERGHGGVVLGSEMSGDITDITVAACEMTGTDRGLRLKTRRGRGGRIDRVTFRDVTMTDVETAFSANAFYYCDHDGHDDWVQTRTPAPVTHLTPHIGRIEVSDVTITGLSHALGAFIGLPEQPIGPIHLTRITVLGLNPDAVATAPVMADHIRPLCHAGFAHEHAQILADPDIPIEEGGLTLLSERTD